MMATVIYCFQASLSSTILIEISRAILAPTEVTSDVSDNDNDDGSHFISLLMKFIRFCYVFTVL